MISFGSAEAFFTAIQAGITAEDRVWVKRRLLHEPNQRHNHVNVQVSLELLTFMKMLSSAKLNSTFKSTGELN